MKKFSDIKGHDRIIARLRLLDQQGGIPNTLLFSGREGIGKRLVAESFLASLFCTGNDAPCGVCRSCSQIDAGTFPDLVALEPNDKGAIPIGNAEKKEPGSVRWLIDRLSKRSMSGRCGVIIDGVDRISEEGQNALLKTVEEPGAGTVIVLVTADRSRVIPTILSRCFELSFSPIDDRIVVDALVAKGCRADEASLIAGIGQGSFHMAELLAAEGRCAAILGVAADISGFLIRGDLLTLELAGVQKYLSNSDLVDVLLGVYRMNLRALAAPGSARADDAAGECARIFRDEVFIDNFELVTALMKIILALREGLRYNLNVRISLKGLLYRLRVRDVAIPTMDITPEIG